MFGLNRVSITDTACVKHVASVMLQLCKFYDISVNTNACCRMFVYCTIFNFFTARCYA